MKPTTATSEELMSRVRDGDVGQLRRLFERHNPALFGYFHRLTGSPETAEDLAQEVFYRLLKYRAGYRASGDFKIWLYRIARNVWADHGRKSTRDPARGRLDVEPAGSDPAPVLRIEQERQVGLLRRALARLPEDKREVLILSRFQGLKHEQIAQLVDCSLPAIKVRIHRALKQLRDLYVELSAECV